MFRFTLPAATGVLTLCASASFAGEITSLSAGLIFQDGDVSRDATAGGFENDTRLFAHGVYEAGPLTYFGGIETQRSDFGADDDTLYLDLGVEYRFGTFGIGGQLAYIDLEDEGFGVDLDVSVAALYGIYDQGPLEAGAGLIIDDVEDNVTGTSDTDTGLLAFASYDMGSGLTLGGQLVLGDDDAEDLLLYADYSAERWGASFDFINTTSDTVVQQYVMLSGSYQVTGPFSAVASYRTIDVTSGDSTEEIALGGEYAFAPGAALRVQYVDYGAFNSFSGDGVLVGLTYKIGAPRKSGYQPAGQSLARFNSPVFFSF